MTSPPFRVEPVPVRRTGRGPVVIATIAATLVIASIVKPWSGGDPGRADQSREFASPAAAVAIGPAVDAPTDASRAQASPAAPAPAPGQLAAAPGIAGAEPAPLAPGQVACGSSDWRIVTLGDFGRWTVRTWIAISPVRAAGPDDPAIPDLSLGASDVAGLGACGPSLSPTSPGRASRIIEAWRQPLDGSPVPVTGTTFERVTLAQLDPLPSGGPVAVRRLTPNGITELFRPVPASPHGRWPAGRYVLLLASPDSGGDRWIAVDIGSGR